MLLVTLYAKCNRSCRCIASWTIEATVVGEHTLVPVFSSFNFCVEELHWPRKVRYLWPALAFLLLLQALMHFAILARRKAPTLF